jgi:hypothetical protein
VFHLYCSYKAKRKCIRISVEDFRLFLFKDITSLSDCVVLNGKMMNNELEGHGGGDSLN